jgi:hypothetical protein
MHVARNAVEATRRNVHAFLHFFPLYGSLQHIAVEILCFVYYCYILLWVEESSNGEATCPVGYEQNDTTGRDLPRSFHSTFPTTAYWHVTLSG